MENCFRERMLGASGYLEVLGEVTVDERDDGRERRTARATGTFSDGFEAD